MAVDLQGSEDSAGPISAINVTPFVDVVLVLLVIFMITAPALMKDAIGIKLPKAVSSDRKAPTSFGIAINRQGQVLLNGVPTTLENLALEASSAVKQDPETQAILTADEESRHGDLVRVIDTIKQAGLEKFAIQIEREKPEKP